MRRWKPVFAIAAIPLLLSAGAVGAMSYEAANRLVHPQRDLDPRTPANVGLAFEAITLTTEDKLDLDAWWIPANASAAPVVIFLHGYGASKTQALSVASFLHHAGYHVLAFDFRAHGFSEGSHTTLGLDEADDVQAAWMHATSRDDVTRIALFGWSMGAVAALHAASSLAVDAMILDSPFAFFAPVASRGFREHTGLPDKPFVPLGFQFARWMTSRDVGADETVSSARKIPWPLFVIQGLADSLVSADEAAAVSDAAPTAQLWLVPGARHVDAVHSDRGEYEARVVTFLATHLG